MGYFERQFEEGVKAYQAFGVYRDLGPERTLRTVAETLYGIRWKYGKRTVEKWSASFDWVARARAYDDYLEMIRREAVENHELGKAADQARRAEALREENLANEERAAAVERKLLDRAERLIDGLPLLRQTTVREGEDGKPAIYQIEPATKNAVLDAARLHKIATRSEPSRVDVRTKNYDFTNATDDQLQRIVDGEDPEHVLGPGWPEIGQ